MFHSQSTQQGGGAAQPQPLSSDEELSHENETLDQFPSMANTTTAASHTLTDIVAAMSMEEEQAEQQQQRLLQQQQEEHQLKIQQAINLRRRNLSRGTSVANFAMEATIPSMNPSTTSTSNNAPSTTAGDDHVHMNAAGSAPPPVTATGTGVVTHDSEEDFRNHQMRNHAREPSLADAAQFLWTIHKGDEEQLQKKQQQQQYGATDPNETPSSPVSHKSHRRLASNSNTTNPLSSNPMDDHHVPPFMDSVELVDADAVDRVVKVAHVFRDAAVTSTPRGDSNTTVTTAATTTSSSSDPNMTTRKNYNNKNDQKQHLDVEEGPGSGNEPDASSSMPSADRLNSNSSHGFYAFSAGARRAMKRAYETSSDEWNSVSDFFKPKRAGFFKTLLYFVGICIPIVGTAALLFYNFENVPVSIVWRMYWQDDAGKERFWQISSSVFVFFFTRLAIANQKTP